MLRMQDDTRQLIQFSMIFTITLILTFLFFFLYQTAQKHFSNNFEITYIFQCLIIHFYLIHVCILSTNLQLNHDSVCNYTLSQKYSGKEKNWDHLKAINQSTLLVRYRLVFCIDAQKLEYSTPNLLHILLDLNIGLMSVLEIETNFTPFIAYFYYF